MKYLLFPLILISFLSFSQDETLKIVSYNLLNFPDGRDDCSNNVVVPHREDTLRKIMDFIQPDIFVACEVQTQAGVDSVLNRSLNHSGATNYATADFTVSSPLNNALFYNTDKLVLKEHHVITTFPRNIDHYVLYLKDPNLDVFYDTTFVEMYMTHLKAGNSNQNEAARKQQAVDLMAYINNRPTDRNVFVCGDMNVYSSNDLAYQTFTTGTGALKDPLNKPGNWNNNGSFSLIHTQSTRTNQNYDCGSTGGLDDRFDNVLVSQNVLNNANNIQYQENSYRSVGNDGNHFNKYLTQGSNSVYPADLVRALFYMSDHLPVALKVDVTYPSSNGLALVPSVTNPTCYGAATGSATITPNLGEAPYTYEWDSNAGNQTTQTATDLAAGTYCVTVTDNLGEEDTYCVTLGQPEELMFNSFITPDNSGNCEGSIQLLVSGGASPYTYEWADFPENTSSSASDLCMGEYEITVTDVNGCTLEITRNVGGIASVESYAFVEKSIVLYPNPASEVLNVSAGSKIENIQITSLAGKRLEIALDKQSDSVYSFNTSTLASGVYFATIQVEGLLIQKKFVVE